MKCLNPNNWSLKVSSNGNIDILPNKEIFDICYFLDILWNKEIFNGNKRILIV